MIKWFAIVYAMIGLGCGLAEADQYKGDTLPGPVMFLLSVMWPVVVGVNIGRQDRDWINSRHIV